MNEIRRYEVWGTAAMACKMGERADDAMLIDYDVARRSYEARQRLARRQGRLAENTLQRVVFESYNPNTNSMQMISGACSRVVSTIKSHPLAGQLRHGDISGHKAGKATYRQVFTSATVCMAASMLMVFLGV